MRTWMVRASAARRCCCSSAAPALARCTPTSGPSTPPCFTCLLKKLFDKYTALYHAALCHAMLCIVVAALCILRSVPPTSR